MASPSIPGLNPKLLVFGPQAVAFDVNAFHKLRLQLQETLQSQWALNALAELPTYWKTISNSITKLQDFNGKELLKDLNDWLSGGDIPESSFPLPNIILSPLVVVFQLTQYSAFLEAALPDTYKLSTSTKTSTETLGLCTGTLSAFAVACSSTPADIQHHGTVAVRLAMLAGALVDAEEVAPSSGGMAMSFSASWNSEESGAALKGVLERFPEVNFISKTHIGDHLTKYRLTFQFLLTRNERP